MKKTKNYEMFKIIDTNRDVKKGHVKKIKTSILEKNLLEHNPIIVDQNMVVIDGQHRLQAAKELGVNIHYTNAGFAGIREIRRLNSSQSRWSMEDFVKSFAKTNSDYQYLWDFSQAHAIPLSVASQILSNFTKDGTSSSVRNGDFKLGSLEQVNDLMDAIKKLEPFISDVTRRDGVFSTTIMILSKQNVDWDRMENKAKIVAESQDNNQIITKQANQKNYLRIFEDIYNHRVRTKARFF